jgi:calcium-dependent protein kinase
MGNILDKICPCFYKKRTHQTNPSFDKYLSQELLEEYKSQNISIDFDKVRTVQELKIKTASFVRESDVLPNEVYEKVGYIGEGSYGTVLKVKPKYLNEERAMKIIKKANSYYNVSESEIYNEIKILKSLDHPNIIKIHEFFSDNINFYIITELFEEGDLYSKIRKFSFFSERVVKNIMKQILSAVSYLHSKHIIHGDLKLENILIDSSAYRAINRDAKINSNKENYEEYFDIKVIDFGCSKIFTKDEKYNDIIGTTYYMAPEVSINEYDEKSDLWSCGVIMYILLSGKAPFEGADDEELTKNLQKGEFHFKYDAFKNVSSHAKELIQKLLRVDTKTRISARQAQRHAWFKNEIEELNLIELNYSKAALNNLKNFNAEQKFQQAVITYITHNLVKKIEIQNLRKIFKVLDKDDDGRISKQELKNAFREILGEILADIELENIFKTIDHDHNGYIEYEEFLRATIDKNLLLSESNMRLAFNLFDIDKNGFISIDEIKDIIGGGKSIPDNVMVELLAEIDKKSDEEINFDEFKGIMNKIVKC